MATLWRKDDGDQMQAMSGTTKGQVPTKVGGYHDGQHPVQGPATAIAARIARPNDATAAVAAPGTVHARLALGSSALALYRQPAKKTLVCARREGKDCLRAAVSRFVCSPVV